MEKDKKTLVNKEPTILYEDEALLVIDKPAGLMVHPDGKNDGYTLVDWILKKYPEMKDVGEPALYDGEVFPRPGIVHRIDKDTTGILLIAKTKESYEHLKKEFQERRVQKTYRAICYDIVRKDIGRIERPIGRSKIDFRQWGTDSEIRGESREAITDYRVLLRGSNVSYLELYPKTGRTHQIRVHLKAVRHPIVCDDLYAPKRACLFGLGRTALHALSVGFTHPNGTPMAFEAPLPEDMVSAVAQIKSA